LPSYDDVKQIMLMVAGKTRGIDVFSHNMWFRWNENASKHV